MASPETSYIDYDTFLSPSFSPTVYANTLVLTTNNPADTPLDLSTALSRVLFDVQEIDTHIDTLTTKSALPLIEHTQTRADGANRVLEEVERQVASLTASYQRLEMEVVERYEAAEQVRLAGERLLITLRLGRSVQRCVQLGRQLQRQMEEVGIELAKRGEHMSMVPAANSLLELRHLYELSRQSEENEGLDRIGVVTAIRNEVVAPSERALSSRAQQVIREFSMSGLLASNSSGQGSAATAGGGGGTTYAQTEDTKSRAASALQTLYLLSPTKDSMTLDGFEPTLLISALQSYLQTALTSSLASLTRALATLPTLERTLVEISARCQNIVALEVLLETTKPSMHPFLTPTDSSLAPNAKPSLMPNFLEPLLRHLDTSSLPSYFWRSMASQLSARVQDILARGGVSARTLRTNRDRVREMIRECVDRGSRLPVSGIAPGRKEGKVGNWEREAAVMVSSVMGPLQR